MYSRFIHTAAAGLLMLSAIACGKQLPDGGAGAPMSFRTGVVSKALLDTEGLKGKTIVVNDMHVSADGTTTMQYMSNVPLEYKDAGWTTTPPYYWTKGGLHRFAAHIKGQQVSYRQEDEALESEKITLSADNQPDLLYAFAVRDLDNSAEPHAPVVLDFSHALAAIRLTITNMKEDIGELKISGYELQNIVSGASFSVTADADAVEYTMQPASDEYVANHDLKVPLNESLTLYAGTGGVGTDGSLLVWPQEVDGGSGPVTLVLTVESGQIPIPLSTSSVSRWYAGRRYNYDINLSDDYIRVTATVQPWDIRDVIID